MIRLFFLLFRFYGNTAITRLANLIGSPSQSFYSDCDEWVKEISCLVSGTSTDGLTLIGIQSLGSSKDNAVRDDCNLASKGTTYHPHSSLSR